MSSCVNNLTYSRLQKDDIETIGDSRAVHIFKLMQLSMEYMSHTQNYLEDLLMDYEAEYHCIDKALTKTARKCDANKTIISANKETIHKKKFTLKDYELMFKDLGFLEYDFNLIRFPCEICNLKPGATSKQKVEFKSLFQLEQHYEK